MPFSGSKVRIVLGRVFFYNMASQNRGCLWGDQDTKTLLRVWAEPEIQEKFNGTTRNLCIYEEISGILSNEHGITRTAIQCREKIKKLQKAFRDAEDANRKSGSGRRECPYYDLLAPVLGMRPAYNPSNVRQSAASPTEPSQPQPSQTGSQYDHISDSEEEDTGLDPRRLATGSAPSTSASSAYGGQVDSGDSRPESMEQLPTITPPRRGQKRRQTARSPEGDMSATLKEIMNTAMKTAMDALNEGEDRRLEKIIKLERDRQKEERRHDRFMASLFSQAFGGGFMPPGYESSDSDSEQDMPVSDALGKTNGVLFP